MCVLIFSTTSVWNIYHSKKKKWRRYDKKCILVFMYSTLYSCPILMKLEFFQQTFEKSPDTKFNENPSSWTRVVPCRWKDGQTDRHDKANSHFSQFCKHAQKCMLKISTQAFFTVKSKCSSHRDNVILIEIK